MSLQGFVTWALGQKSVAKHNDGQFLGECVSLINQYCWRVLNIPADAWGHAKDWATNKTVLTYFDKVSDIQPGDILVYGANYGGGFGHIEIALGGGKVLFQNRNGNRQVGTGTMIPNPIAILRKKGVNMSTKELATEDEINEYHQVAFRDQRASPEQVAAWKGKPLGAWGQSIHNSKSWIDQNRYFNELEAKAAQLQGQVDSLKKQLQDVPTDTSEAEATLAELAAALRKIMKKEG
jgi:hypothetical protein